MKAAQRRLDNPMVFSELNRQRPAPDHVVDLLVGVLAVRFPRLLDHPAKALGSGQLLGFLPIDLFAVQVELHGVFLLCFPWGVPLWLCVYYCQSEE